MKGVKALLMDHDGTIVDSERVHYQLWLDILAPFGVGLALDDYVQHHAGQSTTSNAVLLRKENPSLEMSVDELVEAKDRAVDEFLVHRGFPLMPGVRQIIDTFLIRGARVAVVTGAEGPGVQVSIRWHGLEELMSTIVSGDQVENGKPAPDSYLLAADRLGLDPSECVAVEDTEAGINSAASAGVVCIAVPSEMSRTHDFSRADAVVANLAEAGEWISSNLAVGG